MVQIYCARTRPLLEYACQAWHPGLTEYLESDIEHIQKRAMNIIFSVLGYAQALEASKLTTLKTMRVNLCLGFIKKIATPGNKLSYLMPKPTNM